VSAALLSLDDRVAVAGQLKPDDMAEIAAAGYVAVVNNRPDGEALFGQPRTAELAFLDLPFSSPRATPEQVRAFAELLAARPGRVVAFCKSGMRSALLWGAAAIASGRSLDDVLVAAMRAGQNLEPLGETMVALARSSNA
jgi:uncharacterized protein (TIGR01244 family)